MTILDLVDAATDPDLVATTFRTILRPSFSPDELPDEATIRRTLGLPLADYAAVLPLALI